MGIDNDVLRKLYDYLAKKMSAPPNGDDSEAALAQAEVEEALVHARLHVCNLSQDEQGFARAIFPDCVITDVTSDAIALTHTDKPSPHPTNRNLFCITPKDVENRFSLVVKTLMNQPFAQRVGRLIFLIDTPLDVTALKALEHERRTSTANDGSGPFTDNELRTQQILVDFLVDENGVYGPSLPRVSEQFGADKVWGYKLKSLWKTSILKPIIGKFIMENLVKTLRTKLPVEVPRMQGVELIAEGAWPEQGYFCATCAATTRPLSSRDFVAGAHQTPGEVDLKFLNFLNETFGETFLVRSDDSDYQPILLLFYLRKMFEGRYEYRPSAAKSADRVGKRDQPKYVAMPGIDDMPEVWIDRTTNAYIFKNLDNPDRYINIKCLLQLIANCRDVDYGGLTEEEAAVLNMTESEVDGDGEEEDPRVIEFRRRVRRVHMPRTRSAASSPSSYETLERLAQAIVGVVFILAFRKTDFTDSLELALSSEAGNDGGGDSDEEDNPEQYLTAQFASSAIKLSGKTIRFDKNGTGGSKANKSKSSDKSKTNQQSGKFSAHKLVTKLFDHAPWYSCFGVKFNPATREMEFQIDSDKMLMILRDEFGLKSTIKEKKGKISSVIRKRFRVAVTRLTWVLDYWSNQNVRVARSYSAVTPPDGVPVRYHGLQLNPQTGQSIHGWRLVPASVADNPNSTHIFTLPNRRLEKKLVPTSAQNEGGEDQYEDPVYTDTAQATNNKYRVAFA